MSPRIIDCTACNGDGYADDISSRRCPACKGSCVEEIDDEPIGMDDLFNEEEPQT